MNDGLLNMAMKFLDSTFIGAEAGRQMARKVKCGEATPEQAGDLWVSIADRSHEAGAAFLSAYDAEGAPR